MISFKHFVLIYCLTFAHCEGEKWEPNRECDCDAINALLQKIETLESIAYIQSCEQLFRIYPHSNGVANIFPFVDAPTKVINVACEKDDGDEGNPWMIIQRRQDGSEDFFRGWTDYVNGFGNVNSEYWLGLNNIHSLTKDDKYELRIDLEDFEGEVRFAHYNKFIVEAGPFYTLRIGGYTGDAGDSMQASNNNKFSTWDHDQDNGAWHDITNCAENYEGGFWYSDCFWANLNGRWGAGGVVNGNIWAGIVWKDWKGWSYSLKRVVMKIRRK